MNLLGLEVVFTSRPSVFGGNFAGAEAEGFDDLRGFGEHHAGFAGDGDELETLGQATLGIGRVDDVDARRDAKFFTEFGEVIDGVNKLGVIAIEDGRAAHGVVEIVRADKEGVDPGDGEDLLGVLDRFDVLDHDDDEDFVIGASVVGRGVGFEIDGVELATNGALAEGRITGGAHGGFGLLPRVDHRHNDAVGAGIEHPLDVLGCVPWNARERNFAAGGDDGEAGGGGFEGDGCVLELDRQPIKAGAGHETGPGGAGHGEPCADARFAILEFGADVVGAHFNP